MTFTFTQEHPRRETGFLAIPLEVRLMIYDYLSHQTQPLTHAPLQEGRHGLDIFNHFIVVIRHNLHESYGHNRMCKKQLETVLSCVRATCKQLHRELQDLVKIPGLRLISCDALENKQQTLKDMVGMLQQDFVKQNVVSVNQTFVCNLGAVACRHRTKRYPSYYAWSLFERALIKATTFVVPKIVPPVGIEGDVFRELVKGMQGCEKLQSVFFLHNHGDLIEWWRSPVRDFEGFEVLLKRGVQVRLSVQATRDSITSDKDERDIDVYHRVRKLLAAGGGNIILTPVELRGVNLALRE